MGSSSSSCIKFSAVNFFWLLLNQPIWKICPSNWITFPHVSGWKQKSLKPSPETTTWFSFWGKVSDESATSLLGSLGGFGWYLCFLIGIFPHVPVAFGTTSNIFCDSTKPPTVKQKWRENPSILKIWCTSNQFLPTLASSFLRFRKSKTIFSQMVDFSWWFPKVESNKNQPEKTQDYGFHWTSKSSMKFLTDFHIIYGLNLWLSKKPTNLPPPLT